MPTPDPVDHPSPLTLAPDPVEQYPEPSAWNPRANPENYIAALYVLTPAAIIAILIYHLFGIAMYVEQIQQQWFGRWASVLDVITWFSAGLAVCGLGATGRLKRAHRHLQRAHARRDVRS
jgi:hypothetical protein